MVVVSVLSHAEFELNDHREDAAHFNLLKYQLSFNFDHLYLFFIFCNEYFKYFFRYDYLSLNDDGLLTPNSTVNSITADYTRELILSQNRRSNLLATNTNSSNGHSNDSISSPPSNSKV